MSIPAESFDIYGLAVLKDQLFVGWNDSVAFDIYKAETTLTLAQRLSINLIDCVSDMTSCPRCDVVYVSNHCDNTILVLDRNGVRSSFRVDYQPWAISVNLRLNLLITANRKLLEYTPSGQLVREISLPEEVVDTWHAVQLDVDLFIVSHGIHFPNLHRVCIINGAGDILQAYGGIRGANYGQFNEPRRLLLFGEFLFVLDSGNKRVLLFNNSPLSYIQTVFEGSYEFHRIALSDDGKRLYVGDIQGNFNAIDLVWD